MEVVAFTYHDPDDLFANCYLLRDSDNTCVVIDPSVDGNGIVDYINTNHLVLKGILLTHGHFDHIRGVNRLLKDFKVDVFVGVDDVELLHDPSLNCSSFYKKAITIDTNPVPLFDGETINVLDEPIKVIYTPYHTSGSVSFFLKESKMVFSGDSLFKSMVGRSDLPTSRPRLRKESLQKLLELDDEIKVYPGHGKSTTIGEERKNNPFIYR